MKYITFLLFFVLFSSLYAQQRSANLLLFQHKSQQTKSTEVHLIVKGEESVIKKEVEKWGGRIKYSKKNFHSVAIPQANLKDFITHASQTSEYNGYQGHLLTDKMIIHNRIDKLHQGITPLPQAYKGKDVIIGIIDTGIDITNPDFQWSDGRTKILALWDQTIASPNNPPQPYNYGEEWDSTAINSGNCTHIPYSDHGSKVAGVAASTGNLTGYFQGAAPESDLVIVASDIYANNWLGTVADAIDYIFSVADAYQKPCVINISMGTYAGSHDGADTYAQLIDQLIRQKEGRAVVCAAGNSGDIGKYHLGYEITTDTTFTWFDDNPSLDFGTYGNDVVFFELWADTSQFNNAFFSFGVDKTTPYYSFRGASQYFNMPDIFAGIYNYDASGILVDTIKNTVGDRLAMLYLGFDKQNDTTYLLQAIIDPDSVSGYLWRFSVTGEGKFDIWSTSNAILGYSDMISSGLPSAADFPDISKYRLPDTLKTIVSSFTCLPSVLTVGNYYNRDTITDRTGTLINYGNVEGKLAETSSKGPTRTGYMKPDVASPGHLMFTSPVLANVASAQDDRVAWDGYHMRDGGTSMASPGVAGIVALLFEKCSKYNYLKVGEVIRNSARQDSLTGVTPNYAFGYGKADAYAAFLQKDFSPKLSVSQSVDICQDTTLFVLSPQGYISFWPEQNSFADTLIANQSGLYYAVVIDSNQCFDISDTLQLTVNPFILPTPVMNIENDTAFCADDSVEVYLLDNTFNIQWSNNFQGDTIYINDFTELNTTVYDNYGCMAISDTIAFIPLAVPLKPQIYQAGDSLFTTNAANYQWYYNGQPINGANNSYIIAQDTGNYQVEVFLSNGCSSLSDVFYLNQLLSTTKHDATKRFLIYPNPSNGEVYFKTQGRRVEVQIFDALGKCIYHGKKQAFHISLKEGHYIFQIIEDDNIFYEKVVVI